MRITRVPEELGELAKGDANVWSRGKHSVPQRTEEFAIVVSRHVLQFLSRLGALDFAPGTSGVVMVFAFWSPKRSTRLSMYASLKVM